MAAGVTHFVTGPAMSVGCRSLREALDVALQSSATHGAMRSVREGKPTGRLVTVFSGGRPVD